MVEGGRIEIIILSKKERERYHITETEDWHNSTCNDLVNASEYSFMYFRSCARYFPLCRDGRARFTGAGLTWTEKEKWSVTFNLKCE